MADICKAVLPRTKAQIFDAADRLRVALRLNPSQRVQMVPLLEHVLPEVLEDYLFEVVPDDMMAGIEGTTDISLPIIRLADRTYTKLLRSDPDARYTAAHELGHLVFHSGAHVQYARRSGFDCRTDPEWQADRFADGFLMPLAAVLQCRSVEQVAAKFDVPFDAARRQYWVAQTVRKVRKNKGSISMKRSP